MAVVIPAFNEEDTIGDVVSSVPRDMAASVNIVVVDDGSRDETSLKAFEAGADYVERLPENRGLGKAFQAGIDKALNLNADYIVNIDADGQFNPQDIPLLLETLYNQEADVVVCSRFLDPKLEPSMPSIKKYGNKMFSVLVSWLTGVKLTDSQCGFRAYTREAALNINIQSKYTYTQESILELVEKGFKIREVACRVKGEREGKSRIVDNSLFYGLRSLLILLRTVRDYHALKFFGIIGSSIFMAGIAIGLLIAVRWAATGIVSPYRSLVTVSATFMILGFLIIILASMADMQNRQRRTIEKILYQQKKGGD